MGTKEEGSLTNSYQEMVNFTGSNFSIYKRLLVCVDLMELNKNWPTISFRLSENSRQNK